MGQSLLEVLRNVALDAGERSAFEADPTGYLDEHGYGDVPVSDLQEAVGLVADTLPPDVAQTVAPGGTEDGGTGGLVGTLQRVDEAGGTAAPAGPSDSLGDADPTTSFGDADFDNGSVTTAAPDDSAEAERPEPSGDDGASATDGAMAFGTGSGPAADTDDLTTGSPAEDDAVLDASADAGGDPLQGAEDGTAFDEPDDGAFDAAEQFAQQHPGGDDGPGDDGGDLDIGAF